jgi:hypothetical protein
VKATCKYKTKIKIKIHVIVCKEGKKEKKGEWEVGMVIGGTF